MELLELLLLAPLLELQSSGDEEDDDDDEGVGEIERESMSLPVTKPKNCGQKSVISIAFQKLTQSLETPGLILILIFGGGL